MDKQQDTSSNMPVPLLDVTEPTGPRSQGSGWVRVVIELLGDPTMPILSHGDVAPRAGAADSDILALVATAGAGPRYAVDRGPGCPARAPAWVCAWPWRQSVTP